MGGPGPEEEPGLPEGVRTSRLKKRVLRTTETNPVVRLDTLYRPTTPGCRTPLSLALLSESTLYLVPLRLFPDECEQEEVTRRPKRTLRTGGPTGQEIFGLFPSLFRRVLRRPVVSSSEVLTPSRPLQRSTPRERHDPVHPGKHLIPTCRVELMTVTDPKDTRL